MKRKLVHSIGDKISDSQPLPKQYAHARLRWLCGVVVEHEHGAVDEYEIKPDRKLYLDDFLDIVKAEIEQFDDAGIISWRVDIYRLTGGR